jgi:dolichol-phosphate mannosyltransferase
MRLLGYLMTRSGGLLSVIVPVYNERAMIAPLLAAIRSSPPDKEIIIVDDGSSDGTREQLLSLLPLEDVTLVCHAANYGKGAAIRTALQYVRGEYVVIQDADLEYDPADYEALLGPIRDGQTNVVYGVRKDRWSRGVWYVLGARALTYLTNVLYGVRIHDEATCYKAFRASLLASMPLECHRFEFCPEVTARLCRRHERIHEVPVSYSPRRKRDGKKLRLADGIAAIWTLVRLRWSPDTPNDGDNAGSPFMVDFASRTSGLPSGMRPRGQ